MKEKIFFAAIVALGFGELRADNIDPGPELLSSVISQIEEGENQIQLHDAERTSPWKRFVSVNLSSLAFQNGVFQVGLRDMNGWHGTEIGFEGIAGSRITQVAAHGAYLVRNDLNNGMSLYGGLGFQVGALRLAHQFSTEYNSQFFARPFAIGGSGQSHEEFS